MSLVNESNKPRETILNSIKNSVFRSINKVSEQINGICDKYQNYGPNFVFHDHENNIKKCKDLEYNKKYLLQEFVENSENINLKKCFIISKIHHSENNGNKIYSVYDTNEKKYYILIK